MRGPVRHDHIGQSDSTSTRYFSKTVPTCPAWLQVGTPPEGPGVGPATSACAEEWDGAIDACDVQITEEVK